MTEPFVFVTDGRTFTCHVESSKATRGESWWWFTVSGDGQRYAAFRPTEGESRPAVQSRIAQYYADRLERIAAPPVKRWSRGGPPDKTGTAGDAALSATPVAAAPPPAE
jgi:hypothetical protein